MLINNSKKGKLSSGELAEVETSYLPTPQTKEGSAGRYNCDRNRTQLVEKKGLDHTIASRSRWPVSQQTSTSKFMQTTSPNTTSIKQRSIRVPPWLLILITIRNTINEGENCDAAIGENEHRHTHETSILFLIHHRHIKRTATVKSSQTTSHNTNKTYDTCIWSQQPSYGLDGCSNADDQLSWCLCEFAWILRGSTTSQIFANFAKLSELRSRTNLNPKELEEHKRTYRVSSVCEGVLECKSHTLFYSNL